MNEQQIKRIIDTAHEINTLWTEFTVLWRSNGLSLDAKNARFYDENFEDYSRVITEMAEAFYDPEETKSLRDQKYPPKIEEVNKHLAVAINSVETLLTEFRAYPDAKFQEVGNDFESIQVFVKENYAVTINIGQHLDMLNKSMYGAMYVGIWWCVVE